MKEKLWDRYYTVAPARQSLHRCLARHGINRLPEMEEKSRTKISFKPYPLSYFHIDIAEVRMEGGKLCLFVAID